MAKVVALVGLKSLQLEELWQQLARPSMTVCVQSHVVGALLRPALQTRMSLPAIAVATRSEAHLLNQIQAAAPSPSAVVIATSALPLAPVQVLVHSLLQQTTAALVARVRRAAAPMSMFVVSECEARSY
jgi:hypothetical protein